MIIGNIRSFSLLNKLGTVFWRWSTGQPKVGLRHWYKDRAWLLSSSACFLWSNMDRGNDGCSLQLALTAVVGAHVNVRAVPLPLSLCGMGWAPPGVEKSQRSSASLSTSTISPRNRQLMLARSRSKSHKRKLQNSLRGKQSLAFLSQSNGLSPKLSVVNPKHSNAFWRIS